MSIQAGLGVHLSALGGAHAFWLAAIENCAALALLCMVSCFFHTQDAASAAPRVTGVCGPRLGVVGSGA